MASRKKRSSTKATRPTKKKSLDQVGWHVGRGHKVQECGATQKVCPFKKHFKSKREAEAEARIMRALVATNVKPVSVVSNPLLTGVSLLPRTPPQIYTFIVDSVSQAVGGFCPKLGDTTRSVDQRMSEWRRSSPLYADLRPLATVPAMFTRELPDGTSENIYVRDYNFHKWMSRDGWKRLVDVQSQFPALTGTKVSNEFFTKPSLPHMSDKDGAAFLQTLLEASMEDQKADYENGGSTYQFYKSDEIRQRTTTEYLPTNSFAPREVQKELISKASNFFRENANCDSTSADAVDSRFMIIAPTRSGKTYSALNVVSNVFGEKDEPSTALVVSGIVETREEWKSGVQSHTYFAREQGSATDNICGVSPCACKNKFRFIDADELARDPKAVEKAKKDGLNALVYLSLQDLAGSTTTSGKVKKKHEWLLKDGAVDLLVGDEAHFAMFKPGGRYSESLTSQEEVYGGDIGSAATELASTKPTIGQLFLTATPYGHVEWGGTFSPDRNVARITETQIREERELWDAANAERENPLPEHMNPIYGLPQTTMFGVDLGMSPSDLYATDSRGRFLHQANVSTFVDEFFGLKAMKGDETPSLSFLNSKEFAESGNGNHIYFHLPTKAAVDAMERELKRITKRANYEVLNISPSDGRGWGVEPSAAIVAEIARLNREGKRTITLTVNRMGTGVTVPEWDTVVIGSSMASAQRFQQVAGRAGSPWVTKSSVINDASADCLKCFVNPVRGAGLRLCVSCVSDGAKDDEFKAQQFSRIEKPNAIVVCLDPHTLINVQAEKIDIHLEFKKAELAAELAAADAAETDEDGSPTLDDETVSAGRAEVINETPTYLVGEEHLLATRNLTMEKLTPTNFIDKLLQSVQQQGLTATANALPVKVEAINPTMVQALQRYTATYTTPRYLTDKLAEESNPEEARARRCQKPKCINPSIHELNRLGNSFRLCDTHYDDMMAEREARANQADQDVDDPNISDPDGTEPNSEYLTSVEREILAQRERDAREAQANLSIIFSQVRTLYTRVLLLSFLTRKPVSNVSQLLKSIHADPETRSTAEALNVDTNLLRMMHRKHALPARLSDVVGVLNRSARSSDSPEKQLGTALSGMDRFSDNELLTPTEAVKTVFTDGGVNISAGDSFYDTSSRAGGFLLEAERRMIEAGITNPGEHLYSTPTSPMAYETVRYLYEKKGWNSDNIIYHRNLHPEETAELVAAVVEARRCRADGGPGTCSVHSPESEAELRETISLYETKLQGDYNKMASSIPDKPFDYIVGNPPYQDRKQQLYPKFFLSAQKVARNVVMVFPEGWQEASNRQGLKELNTEAVKKDKRIVSIRNYGNRLFNAGTDAGIVTWAEDHDNGLNGMQNVYDGNSETPDVRHLPLNPKARTLHGLPQNLVSFLTVVGDSQKENSNWESWTDEVTGTTYSLPKQSLSSKISSRGALRITSDIVIRTIEERAIEDPKRTDSAIIEFPRNLFTPEKTSDDDYRIIATHRGKRVFGYINKEKLDSLYDTNAPKTAEHVKEKIQTYRVAHPHAWGSEGRNHVAWAPILIVKPGEVTTHSFSWFEASSEKEANRFAKYLLTQHARSLLFLRKRKQSTGPVAYSLVPEEAFTEDWWDGDIASIDEKLAEKYGYDRAEMKETLDYYAPPLTETHIHTSESYVPYSVS